MNRYRSEGLIFSDAVRDVNELLCQFVAADADAIDRVHPHLPQVKYGTREEAATFPLSRNEAQTVIARENDAQSWGELRLRIKLADLDFGDALERFKQLVYAKDAPKLDELLTAHPKLKSTIDDPHFYFGSTALIIAKENMDVVDVLLNHGADINAKSQWWAGDFHILEVTSAAAAEQLIERGAEVTVHAAAEQGWLDWLDEAFADDRSLISRRGGDGKTPLHYATNPAVMDWLLERGADREARDLDHASTPLQWHLGAHNHYAARELVHAGRAGGYLRRCHPGRERVGRRGFGGASGGDSRAREPSGIRIDAASRWLASVRLHFQRRWLVAASSRGRIRSHRNLRQAN